MDPAKWMLEAITLGQKGRITAPPNPWVGCMIVKDGKRVGEGWHESPGTPHAEIHALKQAGNLAEGSDLYVTLEPCSHFGRTPPCVQALLKAKPKRVFVGIVDPDPRVSGEGIRILKENGIEVICGVEEEAVRKSLAPYLHHRKTSLPWVVAKAAISCDGKIAAQDGSSKWISGKEARSDAHCLRAESQAIIVGSNTALQDQPSLNVRDYPSERQPLRIILDRRGRVNPSQADRIVGNELSLLDLLKDLGKEGILQVLVEGGGKVLASFLNEGLIQELVLYTGPVILGEKGLAVFDGVEIHTMAQAKHLKLKGVEVFGETVKLNWLT
jgi:diaminohydroxyphosphoribosylaminopyrimidine deaminase/5-amino-6-(5-phosphoribosylamino)uracil reductase